MRARAPIILLSLLASLALPVMIENVYAASCAPGGNCYVDASTNVTSADGTIWVEIDSNPASVFPLPHTFSFPYNVTAHTITVLNSTFTGLSTQGHYVWKEWAQSYAVPCSSPCTVWTTSQTLRIPQAGNPGGILYNYTGSVGFTAVFDKQYPAALSFSDASGSPLSPLPANVTFQPQGSTTTTTINSYSGQYLSATRYTLVSAYWEGTSIGPTTSSESIDLTNGAAAATFSLRAYPATVRIVDANNNPVQGANVTITFVNATIRSFTSNSNGNVNLGDIPSGPFGATVHYQGQQYGPYSLNAAINPTNTIPVNSGSSTTSTTTALVLLVIFGLAFFLILLAIKVRKPSAPPTI